MLRLVLIAVLLQVVGCRSDAETLYQDAQRKEVVYDFAGALDQYRRAAAWGHSGATLRLARLYSGAPVEKKDGSTTSLMVDKVKGLDYYRSAVALLEREAENGDVAAKAELGSLLLHGRGVDQDEERGFSLLEEAAALGNADAQFYLGTYWYWVRTSSRDPKLAAKHLYDAATQNHARAQLALAHFIMHSAAPEDQCMLNEVKTWLRLAASNGLAAASRELGINSDGS